MHWSKSNHQQSNQKAQVHNTHDRRESPKATVAKAKVSTIVDVSEAFHTVVLDEELSLFTTFQGPNGRYCYTRTDAIWHYVRSGEHKSRQHEFLKGLQGVINIADHIFFIRRYKGRSEYWSRPKFDQLTGKTQWPRPEAFGEQVAVQIILR